VSACALVPTLLAIGCTPATDALPAAEVVDSAGVRVVTYDLASRDVPLLTVVGAPELEIGEVEGSAERAFSRIADLAVSEYGSILVSDAVARAIRVFDASGAYLRTLGSVGEGPGELASPPTVAGVAGDTVFVFDVVSQRITAFAMSGDLLGAVTLSPDGVGRASAARRLHDGTLLVQSRWVAPDAAVEIHGPRMELDSIVLARLDSEGAPIDTLRVMADRTRGRMVQDRGGGVVGTIEAPTPYSAHAVVVTDGARTVIGRSDRFELRLSGSGRSPETILRVRGVDHPATAKEIRAHQEAALRADFGDREIDPMTRRLNIDFLPERLPAFGSVVLSDEGNVWVSLSEFDLSDGLDWLVFTAEGELRGRVHTPPEFRLRAIRGDALVGFALDELDVPFVRRYRLEAPGRASS
jgi:hypothetical protein